jgi:hypothetical protein
MQHILEVVQLNIEDYRRIVSTSPPANPPPTQQTSPPANPPSPPPTPSPTPPTKKTMPKIILYLWWPPWLGRSLTLCAVVAVSYKFRSKSSLTIQIVKNNGSHTKVISDTIFVCDPPSDGTHKVIGIHSPTKDNSRRFVKLDRDQSNIVKLLLDGKQKVVVKDKQDLNDLIRIINCSEEGGNIYNKIELRMVREDMECPDASATGTSMSSVDAEMQR